ncbi:MAG: hypothetical protein IGS48_22890 [Oscillatoriales cyanobacterium C42_A2020_001]|nr:hypothetical protein [Leptolyngbyaceae cyanobacterium C42_A2020_001]
MQIAKISWLQQNSLFSTTAVPSDFTETTPAFTGCFHKLRSPSIADHKLTRAFRLDAIAVYGSFIENIRKFANASS